MDIQEVDIAAVADDDELLAVHEAIDKLAVEDPQQAQLAKATPAMRHRAVLRTVCHEVQSAYRLAARRRPRSPAQGWSD